MANSTNSTKVWTPNEKQKAFLDILANADAPMTLAEISAKAGMEIRTGSINGLLENGKGLARCNKNARQIVCACCGHKTNVSTYELIGKADAPKVETEKVETDEVETDEVETPSDADEDLDLV